MLDCRLQTECKFFCTNQGLAQKELNHLSICEILKGERSVGLNNSIDSSYLSEKAEEGRTRYKKRHGGFRGIRPVCGRVNDVGCGTE